MSATPPLPPTPTSSRPTESPSFAPLVFPDYDSVPHDSLQANVYAATVICWVIAAIAVALRFYSRGVIIRVLSWSDWCILLALIFSAGTSAAQIDQVAHGTGLHWYDLDWTKMENSISWWRAAWYGILCYLLSLAFSKLSILFLYIHIFAFKWARLGGQILMGIVIVTTIWQLGVLATACIPLAAYWDYKIPMTQQVYCHPQNLWWSNTTMHMVTDFLIFLLPMPIVWNIMLPRRQKFILYGVFGFGFIVCFISVVRAYFLDKNHKNTSIDKTYDAVPLSYTGVVEMNAAIVCACSMTLKPFLAKHFPKLLASNGSSRRNGSPNNINGDSGPGGPPTIGSRPTKLPLTPAENEMMGQVGSGGRDDAWLEGPGGYVEIDDDWQVDVELGEHKTSQAIGGIDKETEKKDDAISITTIRPEPALLKRD